MIHLFVLFISTVVILILLFLIWHKTRDFSFIAGVLLIYFFTILGGWFITVDLLTNNIFQKYGLSYYYLYEKMFPLALDEDYLIALIFYSLFVVIIELTVLALVRRKKRIPPVNMNPYILSYKPLIFVSFVFLSISFFIMRDFIKEAFSTGISAYALTRMTSERIPFYTIHQIFIRMALFPLSIGLAAYLSGRNGKYIIGWKNKIVIFLYLIVFLLIFSYAAILGNRNELVAAAIIGFLFYIANVRKLKKVRFLIAVICALAIIGAIGLLRGAAPSEYLKNLNFKTFINGLVAIFTTNEMFAAFMSMYGALHFNIPLVYGYSFLSLVTSIVPRDLWPTRPPDIYWHYFNHINAVPGQGYVIHHATGWYLNFSLIGIIIGAILIGFIWAKCFNRFTKLRWSKSHFLNIFTILSPWLFVSAIPSLMRGGLEGYKAVIIEHFLIPVVIIAFLTRRKKLSKENLVGPNSGTSLI